MRADSSQRRDGSQHRVDAPLLSNVRPPKSMRKLPLYRSVNTRTHGVRHGTGTNYRHDRNTKTAKASDAPRGSMRSPRHRRDYTPLFRFLVSRAGQKWDHVYSEVIGRLDTVEPIFWLVARTENEKRDYVRIGESSYFSGMFIDENGVLSFVNSALRAIDMQPSCSCCTHTLNGVRFGAMV